MQKTCKQTACKTKRVHTKICKTSPETNKACKTGLPQNHAKHIEKHMQPTCKKNTQQKACKEQKHAHKRLAKQKFGLGWLWLCVGFALGWFGFALSLLWVGLGLLWFGFGLLWVGFGFGWVCSGLALGWLWLCLGLRS
jgi:hypothetical protein